MHFNFLNIFLLAAKEELIPPYQQAYVGDSKKFECMYHNDLKYTWKLNNRPLPQNVKTIKYPNKFSEVAFISSIDIINEGTYTCETLSNYFIYVSKGVLELISR